MKKITLLTAIAMIAFTVNTFGQSTGDSHTFSADANLVSPITITEAVVLNFGDLAVDGTAGTAAFDTSGVLTSTGGVTLVTGSAYSAASFKVTGESGYSYSLTYPTTFTVQESTTTANETMTITLSDAAAKTLTGGSEAVTLGASLAVGAGQAAAAYKGSFDVTVDYQ